MEEFMSYAATKQGWARCLGFTFEGTIRLAINPVSSQVTMYKNVEWLCTNEQDEAQRTDYWTQTIQRLSSPVSVARRPRAWARLPQGQTHCCHWEEGCGICCETPGRKHKKRAEQTNWVETFVTCVFTVTIVTSLHTLTSTFCHCTVHTD